MTGYQLEAGILDYAYNPMSIYLKGKDKMKQKQRLNRKHVLELIKILDHQNLNPEFYPNRKVKLTEKKIKFYMMKGLES